jgi:hydroxymethylpyrimidine/phosphomethylpyrimidine kinase
MRVALTVAGSDSGAGAGIQADLKTFAAHGVYGTSAITAITAQNTQGVVSTAPLGSEVVTAQIEAVASDFDLRAAKTGMLGTAAVVEAVAAAIQACEIPLVVVDPVLVSTSGKRLLDADGFTTLRKELVPLAAAVTPNIPEAEALTGLTIRTAADVREAARALKAMGPGTVIVTGGHAPGDTIVDLFFDGVDFVEFPTKRVHAPHTHGTGCTFSAALTAHLALGRSLREAIPLAQTYVAAAVLHGLTLGRGRGPMNHFWASYTE